MMYINDVVITICQFGLRWIYVCDRARGLDAQKIPDPPGVMEMIIRTFRRCLWLTYTHLGLNKNQTNAGFELISQAWYYARSQGTC